MPTGPEKLVVVGASLAGLRVAEAARRQGYDGRIRLVGAERHLPYDRPPLSKAFLEVDSPASTTTFREQEHYDSLEVDLVLGSAAVGLDQRAAVVELADGQSLRYDQLVVCTGSAARGLPGRHPESGVLSLRSVDDALRLRHCLEDEPVVVVIGSGFVGSEVASAARARGLDVTIVEALPNPMERAVGAELGRACATLHQDAGTTVRCGVPVDRLEGGARVEAVRLADGTRLPADLVVCGIGASPSTGWLTGSGLRVEDGLIADEYLRAGDAVWAAGDVVRWWNPLFESAMRVEHWTNASEQAAVVAHNLLGAGEPRAYAGVPYFWSDWYGSRIQFLGIPSGKVTLLLGSVAERRFIAGYGTDDRLYGVLAMNWPSLAMKYRTLIAQKASIGEAAELGRAAA